MMIDFCTHYFIKKSIDIAGAFLRIIGSLLLLKELTAFAGLLDCCSHQGRSLGFYGLVVELLYLLFVYFLLLNLWCGLRENLGKSLLHCTLRGLYLILSLYFFYFWFLITKIIANCLLGYYLSIRYCLYIVPFTVIIKVQCLTFRLSLYYWNLWRRL